MFKSLFFCLILSAFFLQASCQQETFRAAIDFGSGSVKIQVATVDTQQNRLIGEPILSTYIPLNLAEDVVANQGYISERLQQQALKTLHQFQDLAFQVANTTQIQFSGIATAVFRQAKNGKELLDQFESLLGIPFQVLSQEEEGKLGFLTAKAFHQQVPENRLLAWDSGNGSFQITTKDDQFHVFKGPLGHGTVRVMLARDVRGGPLLSANESGNPIYKHEAEQLAEEIISVLPPIPDWLQTQLSAPDTVISTFGDGESIFALVSEALSNKCEITLEDVQLVIDTYLDKGDTVFDNNGLHRKTLTSAIHLAAIMRHFGIQRIYFSRSIGCTPGMLISPQLWVDL